MLSHYLYVFLLQSCHYISQCAVNFDACIFIFSFSVFVYKIALKAMNFGVFLFTQYVYFFNCLGKPNSKGQRISQGYK